MRKTMFQATPFHTLLQHSHATSCLRRVFIAFPVRAVSTRNLFVDPPSSKTLPSDSYQLLSADKKAGTAEDDLFNHQVENVNDWWASSRYEGIKRPYSAEDVVSKRGTMQQSYPSSLMARKLFNLLQAKANVGEPLHTSETGNATNRRHTC